MKITDIRELTDEELQAEVAYQLVPESGLIFLATLPTDRSAISDFVVEAISAT